MRHQKKKHKLGRTSSHRKAMLANMAASLIKYERIQTTDAKAKALRPFVERLISLGKKGDLHARRTALSRLRDKDALHKLFAEVGPRMGDRPGGYTRIMKLTRRGGDNAPVSLIELVDTDLQRIMAARGYDEEDVEDILSASEGEDQAAEEAPAEEAPAEEAPAEEAPAEESSEEDASKE